MPIAALAVLALLLQSSGTIVRGVQQHINGERSVEYYSAVGDGVSDDTSALQAAFRSGVGQVLLPKGTYKVTSTLIVGDNTNVSGIGYNTVINCSNVVGDCIKIANTDDADGAAVHSSMSGIRVTGNATGSVVSVESAVFVSLDLIWVEANGTDSFYFTSTFGGSFTNLNANASTPSNANFKIGDGFTANHCANWYTSAIPVPYNFYIDSDGGSNTFDNLTAQGGTVGLYVRRLWNSVFNGYYTENVVRPIILGDYVTNAYPSGLVFNSPTLNAPQVSHPDFAARIAAVDISEARNVTFVSPIFGGGAGLLAPVSFSGGVGTGARAIGRVTPGGGLSSVEVIVGGSGYTEAPKVAVGGAGSGATATAILTGDVVTAVNVTAPGSGYGGRSLIPIRYTYSTGITVTNPFFGSGAGWSLWPWVTRTSDSEIWSGGIHIISDKSPLSDGTSKDYGGDAELVKVTGARDRHYVIWRDTDGIEQKRVYTPPVYP